jgi:hypothetical protein
MGAFTFVHNRGNDSGIFGKPRRLVLATVFIDAVTVSENTFSGTSVVLVVVNLS